MKETGGLSVDLSQQTKQNDEVIKATLGVYFDFLKNRKTSPLFREVLISIPSFATHVNLEIVFDLIANLRQYLQEESE